MAFFSSYGKLPSPVFSVANSDSSFTYSCTAQKTTGTPISDWETAVCFGFEEVFISMLDFCTAECTSL